MLLEVSHLDTVCRVDYPRDTDSFVYYPLSEDGYELVGQWLFTFCNEDHIISGVLADYFEDRRSEMIAGSTDPSSGRLDDLIAALRRRFRRQPTDPQTPAQAVPNGDTAAAEALTDDLLRNNDT